MDVGESAGDDEGDAALRSGFSSWLSAILVVRKAFAKETTAIASAAEACGAKERATVVSLEATSALRSGVAARDEAMVGAAMGITAGRDAIARFGPVSSRGERARPRATRGFAGRENATVRDAMASSSAGWAISKVGRDSA